MNATELLQSLASWPTLLIAIVVYGFAPGFVLRLVVMVYERDDPRRAELIAELYEVPRLKRPFWVAEQIETAIFDGLGPRIRWTLTGRVILRWKLKSGVKLNRLHPQSFWIPEEEEKDAIEPGAVVKLMFDQSDGWSERMWVIVEKVGRRKLVGSLTNRPLAFPRLDVGSKIKFQREHIIDIDFDPHTQMRKRQHTTTCHHCISANAPDPIEDIG
ncbi:DUF2314 domain-containing protein [Amycolatopsis sp. RTGN1]|uniref:DUF2314 domain-containing protein n=1 Tax=Amycolatopsis ponsaeliensis TaxID=2992142 RepID=UPI00254E48D4|nr:hypothetical protein [Amycolatopsis sp. RTGN1]